MTTTEKNKEIAILLGYEYYTRFYNGNDRPESITSGYWRHKNKNMCFLAKSWYILYPKLQFNNNWVWIMRSVAYVENLGYRVIMDKIIRNKITYYVTEIRPDNENDIIVHILDVEKLLSVFEAIYRFSNFYSTRPNLLIK